jgi:hypothetical protein
LATNNADGCIEITTRYGNSDNSGAGDTDLVLNIGHTIFGDMSNRKIRIGMSGVVTSFDAAPDATLEVLPEATTDLVLLAKGTNGQSANLQEWRNASDTTLLAVGFDGGLELPDNVPGTTTNKLYNNGGTLTFNGSAVGGGISNIVEDTSPQLGAYLDAQNHNVSGVGSLQVTKAVFTPITTTTFASPTTTFDLDESNLFSLVLTGSIALAVSNGETGQRFTVKLTQDGTGGRSVTWWAGISWPGGLIPTLSADGGDSDLFGFIKTGASTYDGFVIGYSL